MSPRPEVIVTCSREPSDAAWRAFGDFAAEILERVAERRALAEWVDTNDVTNPAFTPQIQKSPEIAGDTA